MIKLLDYKTLECKLRSLEIDDFANALPSLLLEGLSVERYGDIPRWRAALDALPELEVAEIFLNDKVGFRSADDAGRSKKQVDLKEALQGLHPWRKGPFQFDSVFVDTEWRSDFKWNRLIDHIEPLQDKVALDVGCGSGYHCWRMREAGAELVIGIDPTPLFILQYWAMQKYLQDERVWVVPARLETMPQKMGCFDTVFSMGVLYHRRSPFDHLQELRDALKAGGQLVLETLVIDGGEGELLVPEGRYSKMGNVWFLPSVPSLCSWLKKMKFRDIKVVDVSTTTVEEQRATEWMRFQSLTDFLDPGNPAATAEGYPAPQRAIVVAHA